MRIYIYMKQKVSIPWTKVVEEAAEVEMMMEVQEAQQEVSLEEQESLELREPLCSPHW